MTDTTTPAQDLRSFLEAFRIQTDLVGRLCDAVNREAEDIGGESSLSVLRMLGPHHAIAALARTDDVTCCDFCGFPVDDDDCPSVADGWIQDGSWQP